MIGKKTKRPFMVVYNDEVVTYGVGAAVLLSELRFLSHRRKKDEHGYFTVDSAYLEKQTGFSRTKIIRDRNKLIEMNRIKYIAGYNQNVKSRYKIVL